MVVKTAQSLFFGWFLALFPGEWGWEKPRYPREVKRGSCNALTKIVWLQRALEAEAALKSG